jgi:thiamine biosynthesis lipoprotein
MSTPISRRKFIAISAAAAGLGLSPFAAKRATAAPLIEWRGTSLGALATIRIYHPDKAAAERLISEAVGEARRLQSVFTLYREDSTLCELNRRGALSAPPAELIEVLQACDAFWRLTGGVFDPTVQPLWRCYADHFAAHADDSQAALATKTRAALDLVGWGKVHFSRDRVVLARPGMGLTLNGIAQGYITDRVIARLRAAGISSCLVDMGEIGTLGTRPDGHAWQVAVEDRLGSPSASFSIVDKAVATSAAHGFQFDARGYFNHLFNPTTGKCAAPSRTITVIADTATKADALSTAFALMEDEAIGSVTRLAHAQAFVSEGGAMREILPRHGS